MPLVLGWVVESGVWLETLGRRAWWAMLYSSRAPEFRSRSFRATEVSMMSCSDTRLSRVLPAPNVGPSIPVAISTVRTVGVPVFDSSKGKVFEWRILSWKVGFGATGTDPPARCWAVESVAH